MDLREDSPMKAMIIKNKMRVIIRTAIATKIKICVSSESVSLEGSGEESVFNSVGSGSGSEESV